MRRGGWKTSGSGGAFAPISSAGNRKLVSVNCLYHMGSVSVSHAAHQRAYPALSPRPPPFRSGL